MQSQNSQAPAAGDEGKGQDDATSQLPQLIGPKRGEVECLLYKSLDDREMRILEARSDHRPVYWVGTIGIGLTKEEAARKAEKAEILSKRRESLKGQADVEADAKAKVKAKAKAGERHRRSASVKGATTPPEPVAKD